MEDIIANFTTTSLTNKEDDEIEELIAEYLAIASCGNK